MQRREIGLKLEGELSLEEDFGMGTMKDVFHSLGTRLLERDKLKMCVNGAAMVGAKDFKSREEI